MPSATTARRKRLGRLRIEGTGGVEPWTIPAGPTPVLLFLTPSAPMFYMALIVAVFVGTNCHLPPLPSFAESPAAGAFCFRCKMLYMTGTKNRVESVAI